MRESGRATRALTAAGWTLTLVGFAALAALAVIENRGAVAPPRWGGPLFVRLREDTGPARPGESWLVAVNTHCPHCVASLPGLIARAALARPAPRVRVLIVDQARRPDAGALDAIPACEVWWDSGGVWRRRWRRSAYGEVMAFDATGSFLRVLPAAAP